MKMKIFETNNNLEVIKNEEGLFDFYVNETFAVSLKAQQIQQINEWINQ